MALAHTGNYRILMESNSEPVIRRVVRAGRDPRRGMKSAAALLQRIWRDYTTETALARFNARASALLSDVDRPSDPRAIVVFCDSGFDILRGLHAMTGRALCARRALPLYLLPEIRAPRLADPALATLDGALLRRGRHTYRLRDADPGALHCQWQVDWRNGICAAAGINFAPAILGMLRRDHKRYELDTESPELAADLASLQRSADAALSLCLEIENVAKRRNLPVRILSGELNFVPGGIFNMFCRERGRHSGIEFVDFGYGYSHYFNKGAAVGREFNIANITRSGRDTRFDISRADFDHWLSCQADARGALKFAEPLVRQSRKAQAPAQPEAAAVLRRIASHRSGGGKVACLFGHLTFDLAGLHDAGFAHHDMVDWLNDTLATLAGSDTLVLVKPHVSEARYRQNRAPNQRFVDLIKVPVADNIVLLDPAWFNAHELFAHIDAGLVWRSTAAMELAITGVPTILAGRECYFGEALDFHRPTCRSHYRELLRSIGSLEASEDLALRAANLLRYIAEETLLQLPYFLPKEKGVRSAPDWNLTALAEFRRIGDCGIDRICDDILS